MLQCGPHPIPLYIHDGVNPEDERECGYFDPDDYSVHIFMKNIHNWELFMDTLIHECAHVWESLGGVRVRHESITTLGTYMAQMLEPFLCLPGGPGIENTIARRLENLPRQRPPIARHRRG